MAAEITREQLYRQLHAELPYASAIETEKYEERKDGSVVIHQQILVGRDSQKAIVLGKGGTRIKEIGEAARKELTEALRPQGPPLPPRQGEPEMGGGPRPLPRDRAGLGGVSVSAQSSSMLVESHADAEIAGRSRSACGRLVDDASLSRERRSPARSGRSVPTGLPRALDRLDARRYALLNCGDRQRSDRAAARSWRICGAFPTLEHWSMTESRTRRSLSSRRSMHVASLRAADRSIELIEHDDCRAIRLSTAL